MVEATIPQFTRQDMVSDQAVRWCPGCGDYAILAQMQKVLPEIGIAKENIVFISGIGCSSRFPYYMNTYGIHSIHGRAPTLATGLKIANPDLSVWVITGDGDGLSIGGNHLVHALRRNININIILFNNRIYGLTKGQYSPTSPTGTKTKSSPMGSIEQAFNPLSIAIGAEATFIARTVDSHVKHMADILHQAAVHEGTSFVEIYQNCVIFNDGAYSYATDRSVKDDNIVELVHDQPLIFGKDRDKGIRLNGLDPEIVSLSEVREEDLIVHDAFAETPSLAYLLSRMKQPQFPEPIGVFRQVAKPTYEAMVLEQIDTARQQQGMDDLKQLYLAADTWEVASEFDDEYTGVIFYDEESSTPDKGHSLLVDTLADLKPKQPLTAHHTIQLDDAIARLKDLNVGYMALVEDDGNLAGVFTEGDILTKVVGHIVDLSAEKISAVMTRDIYALRMTDTIAYALHVMSLHQMRHITIVDDDNKPIGVISVRAVVKYIEDNFEVENGTS